MYLITFTLKYLLLFFISIFNTTYVQTKKKSCKLCKDRAGMSSTLKHVSIFNNIVIMPYFGTVNFIIFDFVPFIRLLLTAIDIIWKSHSISQSLRYPNLIFFVKWFSILTESSSLAFMAIWLEYVYHTESVRWRNPWFGHKKGVFTLFCGQTKYSFFALTH